MWSSYRSSSPLKFRHQMAMCSFSSLLFISFIYFGFSVWEFCEIFWGGRSMDLGGLFNPKNGRNPQKSGAAKPGAIPVLNQVMSVAGGATHTFSGISRHVNASLKKIGSKNIEAGIGCGVGFGHGFGAGLALKPGVVHQFQLYLVQSVGKMMTKFGVSQNFGKGILPTSMPSGTSISSQIPPFNPTKNMMQYVGPENPIQRLLGGTNSSNSENIESRGVAANSPISSQTEKVIRGFLQNPALRGDSKLSEIDDGQLQSENRMLHMVLKHEQVIEELKEENEKLRRVLVEDLKISPHKFHSKHPSESTSTSSDCFECRRKQRRR